jgi:hypothetical protein
METFPGAPFPMAWWSFDLGKYRPCDGTYERYPYESLPPLAEPDESLNWITPLSDDLDAEMEIHRNAPEARGEVEAIAAAARERGLTLPPSFVKLMSSPGLQDHIPSCTACTFNLGKALIPCPGAKDAFVVPFLYDQQDCVVWYLYLTPGGSHCVLAFPGALEDYLEEGQYTSEQLAGGWSAAAPTFASFIYRWWLENTIWFKLNSSDAAPFTPTEQAYLDYYTRQRAAQN